MGPERDSWKFTSFLGTDPTEHASPALRRNNNVDTSNRALLEAGR